MNLYFAPLEGITGYLYRNAFHEFFGEGVAKYFTPFIAVSQNGLTKSKETTDISPENNKSLTVVPQLLGNNGKEAAGYVRRLAELGYEEVNLNIGCPYQTVVSKKKGAGLLAEPEILERFLSEVYESGKDDSIRISVKTRIGMESAEEFWPLLEIYNKYPISELIVHPRVRADFYKGHPHMSAFEIALKESKAPVCYNGDIFTLEDYHRFEENYPEVERIMLGRGPLTNPGLIKQITTGEQLSKENLKDFHERIYQDYRKVMSGDKNTLFKMKELWNYMQFLFDNREKYIKKIRKAKNSTEYESAVRELFTECAFRPDAGFEAE